MDAKITLSFDEKIISKAKRYAEQQNISLSRLLELLLDKITSNNYESLEDFPVADWVKEVAEGPASYNKKPKKRTKLKKDFFESRK
jgi:hypothetical protein